MRVEDIELELQKELSEFLIMCGYKEEHLRAEIIQDHIRHFSFYLGEYMKRFHGSRKHRSQVSAQEASKRALSAAQRRIRLEAEEELKELLKDDRPLESDLDPDRAPTIEEEMKEDEQREPEPSDPQVPDPDRVQPSDGGAQSEPHVPGPDSSDGNDRDGKEDPDGERDEEIGPEHSSGGLQASGELISNESDSSSSSDETEPKS